jgi:hypothetical protein
MVFTSASTFGRAVMSHQTASIVGCSVCSLRSATSFRPQATTLAPSAANQIAHCRPIPDVPPVTIMARSCPGTASRARVSSTGASLSGHCSLQFQLGTQAIEITAYGRYGECSAGALKRNAAVPSLD